MLVRSEPRSGDEDPNRAAWSLSPDVPDAPMMAGGTCVHTFKYGRLNLKIVSTRMGSYTTRSQCAVPASGARDRLARGARY
jgi:hypothetical protein